ncbi:hypothetical protein DL771_007186 [Monosporascus sp. 5C6A]|nr:hypothetical protein DL771_007186 [Monosporascus sp. 5C6A]
MSFRLPAGAETVEAFWDMLVSKRTGSDKTPPDRFNINAHHHTGSHRIGSMSYRGGNFLAGDPIAAFDAPFFAIGAKEAQAMDPVHRLTLETAYRALENAGLSMEQVAGSQTAVFAGSSSTDYSIMMSKDPTHMAKYTATGTSTNMMANRISWFFNLTGPSASVSAACSSSLVALDMTCQSIWAGNATMGLACGGNVIVSPENGMWLDNLGMLSKDSQCYTLDKRANGFARGEGCGVLVIKPVSAAIRDGDTIRAVIRATHSNSNGKTAGLTQPSHAAQYRLILDTYAKAGLDLASTRYFEAHGTGKNTFSALRPEAKLALGTQLGDPTEFGAVGAAFSPYRSLEEPLYVGSVKSNIGHLEGASGIAGVIKAILGLEAGVILPNANFQEMNPNIDAELLRIDVAKDVIPWPTKGLRRTSVQSFGFGGSNSHVIPDDAYGLLHAHGLVGAHNTVPSLGLTNVIGTQNGSITKVSEPKSAKLLVWSSEDELGIYRVKEAWKQYFGSLNDSWQPTDQSGRYLADLAYTLASRRTHLDWRSFAVATNLNALADLTDKVTAPVRATLKAKIAFIFTGQGSQWFAMGRELIDRYEVFKNSLVDAGVYFQTLGCTWDIVDELRKDESGSNVNNALYSQPLCTALQVALVELLDSFGIRPAAVIGHSSGEIAAAYCMGAISRRSAWMLAYWRGVLAAQLAQKSSTKGGMLAVRDRVHLDQLQMILNRVGGIFSRRLRVDVAYHSFQMKDIVDEYEKLVRHLEPGFAISNRTRNDTVIMASSVTGLEVSADTLCAPQYWVQNLVSPVLWSDALSTICNLTFQDEGLVSRILEIGPHSTLRAPSKAILHTLDKTSSIKYIPLLLRNVSAVHSLLEALGHLHCLGLPLSLARINNETARKDGEQPLKALSYLPQYPFNHSKSYWHESRISKGYRFRQFNWHQLLGVPDSDWNPLEAKWRHVIRTPDQRWVEDHNLGGIIVFPAAGMLVMAIEAAKQFADPSKELLGFTLKNTRFHSMLKVPTEASGIEVNLHMRPRMKQSQNDKCGEWHDFRLYTHDSDTEEWQEKCHGSIQLLYALCEEDYFDAGREFQEWHKTHRHHYMNALQSCTMKSDANSIYKGFRELGYEYGPAFRAITTLAHNGSDSSVGEVQTHQNPDELTDQMQDHVIHPATLDCIFQVMFAAMAARRTGELRFAVPSHIDHLRISSRGLSYPNTSHVKIDGFRTTDIGLGQEEMAVQESQDKAVASLCHHIHWKPDLDLMSADQVQSFCDASVPPNTCDAPGMIGFFTDVDFLVTAYIKSTLRSLSPQTAKRLQAKSHTGMYLAWMNRRMDLLDSGKSPFSTPEWRARLEDSKFVAHVTQRVAATNSSGVLYTTVGANMQKLLGGEVSPLDFLFSGDLVKAHYYGLWEAMPGVHKFRCFLDALVHKNPSGNILEIGAGTGGTTAQLMKTLTTTHDGGESCPPRFACFDYTDISSFFFTSAKEQFSDIGSKMRFRKLDIENDPETQGFESGSYDIVVAANASLQGARTTLTHCRKLLKPGGKLVLWEHTVPDGLRTNFVFGLLEGWWLASEAYRKWSPCLDEKGWHDVLENTGFTGTDVVLRDYDSDVCHEFSIIISTATAEPELVPFATFEDTEIFIIHESEQDALAQSLKTSFESDRSAPTVRLTSLHGAMRQLDGTDSDTRVFLIFLMELSRPFFRDMTPVLFSTFQTLLMSAYKVLWVHRDDNPAYSLIDGVSRVVNSELGSNKLSRLSLRVKTQLHETHVPLITQVGKRLLLSDDTDTEYDEGENGTLLIPRLLSPQVLNDEVNHRAIGERKVRREWKDGVPLRLVVGSPGLLETLYLREDRDWGDEPLKPDEVEIEARSVGLNFKDILVALGRLNEQVVGYEVAGTVTRLGASALRESGLRVGDRVVSFAENSYRTFVRCDWRSMAKIPDGLEFSPAAAIPANFITAWHALHDIARLQPAETILVHSAAGGTGQAAVQVAQHFGAVVYATVGSENKRSLLMERYGIPTDRIFSSRNVSFASSIRRMTLGKGVDVVFNSLSGNGPVASWECIAPYGRFVEIGKKDILEHSSLPMTMFEKNVSFTAIDVSMLNRDRPRVVGKALKQVLGLVAQGSLAPAYPLQLHRVSEIQKPFRALQSGKTMGKIVVELRPDDTVEAVLGPKPNHSMDPTATYVIAGGLGGLGRSVASWLVRQGARYLILLSRSGGSSASTKNFVRELGVRGARVETPACDISNLEALSLARYRVARGERATALDLGPLCGIGWVAENTDLQAVFNGLTDRPVNESELHALLDYFVNPASGNLPTAGLHCQTAVLRVAKDAKMTVYLDKPMFRGLAMNVKGTKLGDNGLGTEMKTSKPSAPMTNGRANFAKVFAQANTLATATKAVTEALTNKLAETLGLKHDELDMEMSMHRYGVDSLVAVELRNWLAKKVRADVPILDFMGTATISNISRTAAAKSRFRKPEWTDDENSGASEAGGV